MIKTGIMGGTFDPIHNGHLLLARFAKEQYGLDEVWFMTSGNPPHKRNDKTDADIRHEMVCIALGNDADFVPCDYEVNRKELSYSVHTMEHFTNEFPEREFYFIIGEDSLMGMPKWYEPKRLLELTRVLVYPRDRCGRLADEIREIKQSLGGDIREIKAPMFEISSTDIRKRISDGLSVRHMLPDAVCDYISESGLYR